MTTATATAATAYTQTTEYVNGVKVDVYGGTARPVKTLATEGHVTGWRRRDGARTTYAELTCTCHLVGESHFPEGKGKWVTYGEEGWSDRINAQARAHILNVTSRGYMVRPARGDSDRVADRTRIDYPEMLALFGDLGVSPGEALGVILDGRPFTAEDGTRFELARDRKPVRG